MDNWKNFFIESLLAIILIAPLASSILLGIFISWWFLFINTLYLIMIPLIIYVFLKMITIYSEHN